MAQSASVNDQYEATWSLAVVGPYDGRNTSINTVKGVARSQLLLALVQANTFFRQNTAFREELLDSVQHLRIHWCSAFATTTNNDDVVIAADEVRAVTNSYRASQYVVQHKQEILRRTGTERTDRSLEFVTSENPDLDVSFLEVSNCLGNAVLETILDCSST